MTASLKTLFPDYIGPDAPVLGVTQDSRAVRPGYVFFALKGQNFDGAKFISKAIKAGAIAIVAPRAAFVNGAPHIMRHYPDRALALAAKDIYTRAPNNIVAITGTNGKSSTVDFLRQIWTGLGISGASLGTLGAISSQGKIDLGFTTPTAETLHQTLEVLWEQGVTHCAMEASSHGLAQFRMDGVTPTAVAFTNFTQDHLDYHLDMKAYRAAKLRLFSEIAPAGSPAIINADDPNAAHFSRAAQQASLREFSFGWRGRDLKIQELSPKASGQVLSLEYLGGAHRITLPLIGEFQALNALTATACALAMGANPTAVFSALEALTPVKGRLEHVGSKPNGAEIYVDFAHTPDGLDTLLRAIRPHTKGALHCVFGCGGDRDQSKRPLMGQIAAKLADRLIITDDNPRTEDPLDIRAQILSGCPNATEIADRAAAIAHAVSTLEADDILIIAGKGHETGQIIGATTLPFSDQDQIKDILAGKDPSTLWTSEEIAAATQGRVTTSFSVNALSIDTRTLERGALFVALKDQRDGHDFVDIAHKKGAVAALISRPVEAPLSQILVPDVLEALTDLAEAARDRSAAKRYAITGSVGKTSVKEMLAQIFRGFGPAHWPEKSFNNHWGVPLTMARMPHNTVNAVFEIGMSTPGEIAPRSRLVRPDIALITRVADAHLEGLGSLDAVAKEKAAIFAGLASDGIIILPRDDQYFDALRHMGKQRAPQAQVLTFGQSDGCDARFLDSEARPSGEVFNIQIDGQRHSVEINARGAHWGLNIAAALLAARAGGLDLAQAAKYLNAYVPPQGRGTIETLPLAGSNSDSITLMDDSYNANPTSMRAGLAAFAQIPCTRRIAILGEMLEIGDNALEAHLGLADALVGAKIDKILLIGEKMSALGDSLVGQITSHTFRDVDGLMEALTLDLSTGDAVFVKGSNASGIGRVAAGLRANSMAHTPPKSNLDTPNASPTHGGGH